MLAILTTTDVSVMNQPKNPDVVVLNGNETPEQNRQTFISRASAYGHNAKFSGEVGNVQTTITCYGGDTSQMALRFTIKNCDDKPDLPDDDIMTKDITRVGRSIIASLKGKGYQTETSNDQCHYMERSHIMDRADATIKAPAAKTPAEIYDDLIAAHIEAKLSMDRLLKFVARGEQRNTARNSPS